ncbi:hypothetical protein [Streptomyces sp. NPDC008312]|uniref:Uncharacterized protein n=1 Tax=Streptomyces silvae TaxID=2803812 RepID=A0ABU7ZUU2_9ACTN|nr:hypothetical protein [Streptomyces sp. ME02-6979-3A]WSS66841.1 hypothetical protein OG491_00225 [Streptomyces sp. NBC_01175]WSS73785.1 hypothetical protein OG414_00195 [Streptomyces sp. NBC_01174]WSS80807.1 hypothetical protein OG414_39020 [Streptomyces sp. NBC_01174]
MPAVLLGRLGQQFVVEGFADIASPKRVGGLIEDGEDAEVVRVLGQIRHGDLGGDPVGEGGDGLPGDREVFDVGLGLSQPGL